MVASPWETLLERCKDATEALIVAPYIKVDTLMAVIDQLHPAVSLQCFTRWTPLDIQMGASDLDCRTIVIEQGGTFRLHNRLHAKYYRFDDQVLVGSANLTAAGLSYPRDGNLEILCEPGPQFVPGTFEAKLRSESKGVSDEDFLAWRQCPVLDRMAVPLPEATASRSLDDWIPQTRNPEYLWLHYSGSERHIVSEEQRTLAQQDLSTLEVPLGLTAESFRGWMRLSLEASPFMDSVRSFGGRADTVVWDSVAAEWGVSRSTAARWVSTAHNWLRFFE